MPVALSTVRGAGTDTGGTALLDFLTEIGVTGKRAAAMAGGVSLRKSAISTLRIKLAAMVRFCDTNLFLFLPI